PALGVLTVAAVAVVAGLSAPDEAYAQNAVFQGTGCTNASFGGNVNDVAIGCNVTASTTGRTAVGGSSTASAVYATALGFSATA
ncbi:hypothetical protein, partial [Chryseobacterium sp. SIMBA_028]|uniref:hypothetical protein n=1 Tax=Chryseobacterium sp. SIMBA_028 TaxID=3085771 RepID=UPI0039786187